MRRCVNFSYLYTRMFCLCMKSYWVRIVNDVLIRKTKFPATSVIETSLDKSPIVQFIPALECYKNTLMASQYTRYKQLNGVSMFASYFITSSPSKLLYSRWEVTYGACPLSKRALVYHLSMQVTRQQRVFRWIPTRGRCCAYKKHSVLATSAGGSLGH